MKKRIPILTFLVVLTLVLVSCQLTGILPSRNSQNLSPTQAPRPTASANLGSEESLLVNLYQRISPGVVAIRAYSSTGTGALGSGWVYSSDGYIVTNNHVVEGESKVEVDFPTGYKAYGTVAGADPHSDLAVIKVDAPSDELHPLTLGDSNTLQPGQVVVAIGDPFGLNGTMTTGIVSAVGRAVPSNVQSSSGGYFSSGDTIQTDAALNPGNSGGPLLDLQGEVVGVNGSIVTSGYTKSGEPVNSGIGFAISINIVKRVVPNLISTGKFAYPYMGIGSQDNLLLEDIQALGLKSNTGVYVVEVIPGGPAEKAGIRAASQSVSGSSLQGGGDLIVAVDGTPVQWFDDLLRYLVLNKAPGDTIVLTVLRGDQKVDISLTLGARP